MLALTSAASTDGAYVSTMQFECVALHGQLKSSWPPRVYAPASVCVQVCCQKPSCVQSCFSCSALTSLSTPPRMTCWSQKSCDDTLRLLADATTNGVLALVVNVTVSGDVPGRMTRGIGAALVSSFSASDATVEATSTDPVDSTVSEAKDASPSNTSAPLVVTAPS